MTGDGRAKSRSKAAAGNAPAVRSPRAAAGTSPGRADPADRPVAVRLARLHLRMGSLPLARAELEALAGRAMLDEDALLDLAEARWRTGDLAGAGEAANVLLARGREDALALVIAAESVAAQGRPGEARRLAGRALEASDGPLDALFAGMPRSPIWPAEEVTLPDGAPAAGEPTATRHGPATGASSTGPAVRAAPDAATPASTGAAEAYAGGRAALGAGDTSQAAVRLGVALRLEPGYAHEVLEAIGERADTDPELALVAGDALPAAGPRVRGARRVRSRPGSCPGAGRRRRRSRRRPRATRPPDRRAGRPHERASGALRWCPASPSRALRPAGIGATPRSTPARAARVRAMPAARGTRRPMTELQRTLLLVKPDGVQRQLVGRVLTRFEERGPQARRPQARPRRPRPRRAALRRPSREAVLPRASSTSSPRARSSRPPSRGRTRSRSSGR